jgi:transposase
MSMYPQAIGSIPEESVRLAHAACPKGTLAMPLRDSLAQLDQDEQFGALYPLQGQAASAPWRLAIVTVLQVENSRLPKAESQRTARAQQIAADGLHLLHALEPPEAAESLKDERSVQLLRQVWQQDDDLSGGKANWRAGPQANEDEAIMPCPSEPEARTGKKRETTCFGYKVQLSESCALETTQHAPGRALPPLIVQVQTSVANVADVDMTEVVQEDRAQHHLLPEQQIVESGYVEAQLLLKSQQHSGVKLVAPVLSDSRW